MAKMWEYKCRGGNKYSPGGWSPSATVHTKDDFLPAHVQQNKEYYSNIYPGPSLPQLATTRYYYMWPHVLRFRKTKILWEGGRWPQVATAGSLRSTF